MIKQKLELVPLNCSPLVSHAHTHRDTRGRATMRSILAISQCLTAIALLPFTIATLFNGLQARRYTNGTSNNTTIAPKVFLIDMVSLLL